MKKYLVNTVSEYKYIFEIEEKPLVGPVGEPSTLVQYHIIRIIAFEGPKKFKTKTKDGYIYCKEKTNIFKAISTKWKIMDFVNVADRQKIYKVVEFEDDEEALLWYKLNY